MTWGLLSDAPCCLRSAGPKIHGGVVELSTEVSLAAVGGAPGVFIRLPGLAVCLKSPLQLQQFPSFFALFISYALNLH